MDADQLGQIIHREISKYESLRKGEPSVCGRFGSGFGSPNPASEKLGYSVRQEFTYLPTEVRGFNLSDKITYIVDYAIKPGDGFSHDSVSVTPTRVLINYQYFGGRKAKPRRQITIDFDLQAETISSVSQGHRKKDMTSYDLEKLKDKPIEEGVVGLFRLIRIHRTATPSGWLI